MVRLIDRLSHRASSHFVGREVELALVGKSLQSQPLLPSVFLVHGPGGVGKTALLERLRSVAADQGFVPLRLDARDIEPSPEGLLRALGAVLGIAPEHAGLASVLERWFETPKRLWLLDSFEHLSHLQGWLRQVLLPELPDQSVVLIAGRALPDADWQIDPLWREGARVIALTNLPTHEAAQLLAQRGVPVARRESLAALSYGHPLALTLLADVSGSDAEDMPAALSTDVVRQLCDRFVAKVPSDLHRRALELCAKTRFTTEGLLADVLDAARAHELFEWLASLSFMQAGLGGLFPHDLVRDAIDDELRWRHPERHRDAHTALLAYFRGQSMRSGAEARPLAQFDLMYLYRRSPVMGRYIDFRALGSVWFEPYARGDRAGVLAVAKRELSPQECRQIEGWLDHPAAHVQVLRPTPGTVAGAMLSIDLAVLTPAERARDPALEAIWAALQLAHPLTPGQMCLVGRHHIAVGGVPQVSATMNALQMSQGLQWATLPRLAQYVNCTQEPDYWTAMMAFIGFARMPNCDFVVAGVPHGCWLHDWRVQPLGEWQEMVAARQLGLPEAGASSGLAPGEKIGPSELRYAVRDALRLHTDAWALQTSALLCCAFVQRGCRNGEDEVQALQRILLEAAQALRDKRRDEKFWRALELTFFKPAGSQELAAERLGLPFGTYRYQLATGIDRVVDALWRRELAARG